MLGALLGLAQGVYGLYSANKASQEASDNQKRLERQAANSPIQKASPELAQYYQQALNRYNENPFQSAGYMEAIKQGNRTGATLLKSAQTRGQAIGNAPRIEQAIQDSKSNAIASAIQNKGVQFSQFGQAAQAKAAEQNRLFNTNQQAPYERMLQLQQLKTQAANERYNAGLSTLAQGVGNVAQYYTAKEIYNKDKEGNDGSKSNWFKNLFGGKNTNSISTADLDVTGSPYGKYNENDFIKYGVGNRYGYNSYFGKKYNTRG